MTWVRRDDNTANHPKVRELDDATYRLWSDATEWSSRTQTDGVIRRDDLTLTSRRASTARAAKLVAVRLWHKAGEECDHPKCPPSGVDGWVIHDYWDYNPTSAQVKQEQEKARERQRNWRASKRGNGPRNGVTDGDTEGVTNGFPAPPRPAPKEAGAGTLPTSPPAAVGGVAPAGGEGSKTPGRRCPTCGNALDHPYHLGPCRKSQESK